MAVFGERMRKLRVDRGMSQKELADRIGTHKNAISNYESGKRMPPADILQSLAMFFHVSVDFLLGMDKPKVLPLDNLSEEQCMILLDLATEFRRTSTKRTKKLSPDQWKIINEILGEFTTERD